MIYVQVISCPPPIWSSGGTARQSDALIRLFAKESQVILLTSKNFAVQAFEHYKNLQNVTVLPTVFDFSKTKPMGLFDPKMLSDAILSLKKCPVEKVIFHCLENKSLLAVQAFLYAKYYKFEFWLSPFGQGAEIFRKSFNLFTQLYIFICKNSDKVLCQNHSETQIYEENISFNNIYEAPLLIESRISQYFSKENRKYNEMEKIHFGFLGRNTPLKGIFEIVDFVEEMSQFSQVQVTFALAGKCEALTDRIENSKIDSQIIFIDDSFDRFSFYNLIDVFVILPRVQEETSLAALEAALLGCKVVYNENCRFYDDKAFGSICREIGFFDIEWLHFDVLESEINYLRSVYLENMPQAYLSFLDD